MRKIFTLAVLVVMAVSAKPQQVTPLPAKGPATSVPANPATLLVAGVVRVNKQPAGQATSTLFSGDQIETDAAAAARISAPGMSIYLPANSCLKYGGQELELCNCGSIDVNAMKPVSIIYRERELAVSSQPNSTFTMSVAGRDLQILSRTGSTEVTRSGSIVTHVVSGSSRSLAGLGCVGAAAIPSHVGIAAAVAAPAVISSAVIKAAAQRPSLSSTTP